MGGEGGWLSRLFNIATVQCVQCQIVDNKCILTGWWGEGGGLRRRWINP